MHGVGSRKRVVINVDHVATVRQARGGVEPDPIAAATLALLGGADGIVVHLREDRRHIQDRDAHLLREVVHGLLCLEMAATPEMLKIALELRPDSVTLVPERREELTTEGGLDVVAQPEPVREICKALADTNIRTCLFLDPEIEQVKAAHRVNADAVELHTGRYAEGGPGVAQELSRLRDAARLADKLGLDVGVGHGIDYRNAAALAEIPEVREFSVGHAVVSRALLVGMERATRELVSLVSRQLAVS
jgi:pyridoxine 5-phosphate synthase